MEKKPYFQPNYSLTPIPSPNGKASPNPSEGRGEPNGS